METENNVENLNEVVDIEAVAPVSDAVEAPRGRNAAEAAFDKVVAEAETKSKPVEEKDPVVKEAAPAVENDAVETEEKEETTTEPVKGLDPAGKGPNSWKATVREKFRTLPPEVQAEVLRRENEHQKLMSESTDARKLASEFINTVQPYEAFMRSANIHPLQAFKSLLNDAYTLRTGDANTKATVIANIIKTHGVDIGTLDRVLSGSMPEPVDERTAALQREVQELRQRFTQQDTQAQQATQQSIDSQINAFANDPANEFFNDVVGDMQVLLSNGRANDLHEAYAMACRMNNEVYNVLQSRAAAQAAPSVAQTTQPVANVQQKVAASSSVKGAPATTRPAAVKQKLSGRDAALAAWDKLEKTTRS